MASVSIRKGSQQHQQGDWAGVERSSCANLADAPFALKPGQVSDVIDKAPTPYIAPSSKSIPRRSNRSAASATTSKTSAREQSAIGRNGGLTR